MVRELRILANPRPLPFYIEENTDTNEALRLQYRYWISAGRICSARSSPDTDRAVRQGIL